MDHGPPHKIRYTETNRKQSEEEPCAHGHRGKFPEPITYALRSRIDKWDFIKLQSFCKVKDTVNKTKFLSKWMDLEYIILSEVTQSQKNIHDMYSLISRY